MSGASSPGTTQADLPPASLVAAGASARRVVLDTNVLLSLYVFADSRFVRLRDAVESGAWLAFTNDACLAEFRRVLGYPLFALDGERQEAAFAAYRARAAEAAAPRPGAVADLPRCADRDDQKFLELARDARADWLVTADKALLRLARRDRLRGLFRILTPEAALAETAGAAVGTTAGAPPGTS